MTHEHRASIARILPEHRISMMRDYPSLPSTRNLFRGGRVFALLAMAALISAIAASAPLSAQSATASGAIGNLVGDDVTVKGAISFDVAGGRSSALLASGSEITVRSRKGAELIWPMETPLPSAGPAHFTIIEAGGAFTLALDYGEVLPAIDFPRLP